MDEIYVISIKARKNVIGKPCEQWRYAGIDNSSGYPDWYFSDHNCKYFENVESAENWFNAHKQYLFDAHYNRYDFDISTLAIRKVIVIYEKAMSLMV